MNVPARALAELAPPRVHEVVTPEGPVLQFAIARAGDRIGAFVIDALIILVASILLVVLAGSATGFGDTSGWVWAFTYLAIFLLNSFYFIWFESRGQGATPGKRRLGIRIMEARGGPLGTDAVVVRNVMRVLEVQLPLVAMLAPEALWGDAPGWARMGATVWLVIVAGLPLFNRRRLRVGDIVAGTIVVTTPALQLERDVGGEPAPVRVRQQEGPAFVFTDKHLDVYGNYELQVLEELLRRPDRSRETDDALRAVADRIARKIRWPQVVRRRESRVFLTAFYTALRNRLEQRLLFGKRKEDKFSPEE